MSSSTLLTKTQAAAAVFAALAVATVVIPAQRRRKHRSVRAEDAMEGVVELGSRSSNVVPGVLALIGTRDVLYGALNAHCYGQEIPLLYASTR